MRLPNFTEKPVSVKTLSAVWFGPPEWIIDHFPARHRRAFGFWVVVFAITGTLFFGSIVLWVSWLSVIALIPNFTTETPVVHEDDNGKA